MRRGLLSFFVIRHSCFVIGDAEGLVEEADGLLVGVVAQRLLAGLLTVVDRLVGHLRLGPVVRQEGVVRRQVAGVGRSMRLVTTPCTVSGMFSARRSPAPGVSRHSPPLTSISPASRRAYASSSLNRGLPWAFW